jgi:hypothetical protein
MANVVVYRSARWEADENGKIRHPASMLLVLLSLLTIHLAVNQVSSTAGTATSSLQPHGQALIMKMLSAGARNDKVVTLESAVCSVIVKALQADWAFVS